MSSPIERFAFIDSVHAAEHLHVTQEAVLDFISSGRLAAFGGKATNPFLRSVDVIALAGELGVAVDDAPRRTKSPAARVQTRLTADARWVDVGEDDLREWASRADNARRSGARAAAQVATHRLELLVRILDEHDRPA